MNYQSSDDLPIARLAKAYGIDAKNLLRESKLHVAGNDTPTATLVFMLGADDFLAMGGHVKPTTMSVPIRVGGMDAMRAALAPGAVLLSVDAVDALWKFHGLKVGDLEGCGGIVSTAETQAEPTNSEGPPGTEVQHIDAPEDTSVPTAVWVSAEDVTPEQMKFAVDRSALGDAYQINSMMLTPEQVQKYNTKT